MASLSFSCTFFDANNATHDLLHHLECYPDVLADNTHYENNLVELEGDSSNQILHMLSKIDEQGLHSVKTVLMVEFARCSKISGEAVVKAFDGVGFVETLSLKEKEVGQALNRIRMRSKNDEH